jgi:hypothetical protein
MALSSLSLSYTMAVVHAIAHVAAVDMPLFQCRDGAGCVYGVAQVGELAVVTHLAALTTLACGGCRANLF